MNVVKGYSSVILSFRIFEECAFLVYYGTNMYHPYFVTVTLYMRRWVLFTVSVLEVYNVLKRVERVISVIFKMGGLILSIVVNNAISIRE